MNGYERFMTALERAPDVAIALLAVMSGRLRSAQASPTH
mgnify:CR=1 FL=1